MRWFEGRKKCIEKLALNARFWLGNNHFLIFCYTQIIKKGCVKNNITSLHNGTGFSLQLGKSQQNVMMAISVCIDNKYSCCHIFFYLKRRPFKTSWKYAVWYRIGLYPHDNKFNMNSLRGSYSPWARLLLYIRCRLCRIRAISAEGETN